MLLILLVVLLVFGAKRLPEMGAAMGKGIREFKKNISEMKDSAASAAGRPRVGIGRSQEVERVTGAFPAAPPPASY
jgi:sec-independent protein translocase protein TatA